MTLKLLRAFVVLGWTIMAIAGVMALVEFVTRGTP